MRLKSNYIEIKAKQLIVATFMAGGLAIQAFAQTSLPSLPSLPGLPVVPAAPSPNAAVNNSNKNSPSNSLSLTPATGASEVPQTQTTAAVKPVTGSPTPPQLSAIQPLTPPSPEATDAASVTPPPEVTASLAPLPPVASLPEINVPVTDAPALPEAVPVPSTGQKLIFPKIKVVREKAPPKTWETTLAPAVIPVQTNFNYKRQVLPNTIYRDAYSRDNSHLPRRETHEEYEGLLFTSIARHDMDATRALLRAGTNINAVNMYGETPHRFAQRIGANDMAALLAAHGGN